MTLGRVHGVGLVVACWTAMIAIAGCSTVASPKESPAASASVAPTQLFLPTERRSSPTPTPEVAVTCQSDHTVRFDKANLDLTGAWAADDGGIVYVRELASVVWWVELSGRDDGSTDLGRGFTNVGHGVLGKNLILTAQWADVPRGSTYGAADVRYLVGSDPAGNLQITKIYDPYHSRDDTTWTPCYPG
jgi:hypothetical protein